MEKQKDLKQENKSFLKELSITDNPLKGKHSVNPV